MNDMNELLNKLLISDQKNIDYEIEINDLNIQLFEKNKNFINNNNINNNNNNNININDDDDEIKNDDLFLIEKKSKKKIGKLII
jgi:hypothetical protein